MRIGLPGFWGSTLASAVALFPAPALAAFGQADDDGVSLWRVGAALLLCLTLAVAGAFVLRARLGKAPLLPRLSNTNRRLKLAESLRLNPQTEIAIISCDGRDMLIATSASGANLLSMLPPEAGA